ncbi:MAG: hypothetical protein EZS28_043861, partial [Streblomastix strix]
MIPPKGMQSPSRNQSPSSLSSNQGTLTLAQQQQQQQQSHQLQSSSLIQRNYSPDNQQQQQQQNNKRRTAPFIEQYQSQSSFGGALSTAEFQKQPSMLSQFMGTLKSKLKSVQQSVSNQISKMNKSSSAPLLEPITKYDDDDDDDHQQFMHQVQSSPLLVQPKSNMAKSQSDNDLDIEHYQRSNKGRILSKNFSSESINTSEDSDMERVQSKQSLQLLNSQSLQQFQTLEQSQKRSKSVEPQGSIDITQQSSQSLQFFPNTLQGNNKRASLTTLTKLKLQNLFQRQTPQSQTLKLMKLQESQPYVQQMIPQIDIDAHPNLPPTRQISIDQLKNVQQQIRSHKKAIQSDPDLFSVVSNALCVVRSIHALEYSKISEEMTSINKEIVDNIGIIAYNTVNTVQDFDLVNQTGLIYEIIDYIRRIPIKRVPWK